MPRPTRAPLRLVLDTNVWLDWLVFEDSSVAPLQAAVAAGRAEVFVDEAVMTELVRVLGYAFRGRTLDGETQAACLARCRDASRLFEMADGKGGLTPGCLPQCVDPDDQKFLELALACEAAWLVTRDGALLELVRNKTRPLPYRIATPAELAAALAAAKS